MPIPKFVWIEKDQITIQDNVRLGRLPEGYARGADWTPLHVRIGRGNTRASRRVALLHELGHELWKRAALSDHLSTKTEELVLSDFVPWLITMLRNNPELVDFLFKEEP